MVRTGAGRGLSLTRRTARELPGGIDIPVLDFDVTDAAHVDAVRDAVNDQWGRVDGVCTPSARPHRCSATTHGRHVDDVAVALHDLDVLARRCSPTRSCR